MPVPIQVPMPEGVGRRRPEWRWPRWPRPGANWAKRSARRASFGLSKNGWDRSRGPGADLRAGRESGRPRRPRTDAARATTPTPVMATRSDPGLGPVAVFLAQLVFAPGMDDDTESRDGRRTPGGGGTRMLARRRRELIAAHVQRHGSVRVSDLTTQLGVSDMTIRRDLDAADPAGPRAQGARRRDAARVPATTVEPGFARQVVRADRREAGDRRSPPPSSCGRARRSASPPARPRGGWRRSSSTSPI